MKNLGVIIKLKEVHKRESEFKIILSGLILKRYGRKK